MLASASAHWLRHTAGSHMSDRQVDLRHVRDNFGHASIATTSIYLHTEDDARHEATQDGHRSAGPKKLMPQLLFERSKPAQGM
ncbi:tyrosine-type recombinase/integrase [Cupriavidus basilensis]